MLSQEHQFWMAGKQQESQAKKSISYHGDLCKINLHRSATPNVHKHNGISKAEWLSIEKKLFLAAWLLGDGSSRFVWAN